ncbi:hypothetical protein HNV11_11320 [Spirosoma taeanense]|uniref:Uncharacterized protein n=1 Tax=Spirosoma taeanense TaxID=2735870 RepID=A0A6M5Y7Q1_9BACT|nr:hypothetical protein [Spirosoma taeanense]QJW89925.1 hypothetical protein HNV11_11320 [Spirosoma taeanense]
MKPRRSFSLLHRLFCLLMGLHVLNFSVDPPDHHVQVTTTGAMREDLSINEMESVGEWVLEHLFDLMVPEHDEPDDHGKLTKSLVHWLIPSTSIYTLLPPSCAGVSPKVLIAFLPFPYASHTADVLSPPPQLV